MFEKLMQPKTTKPKPATPPKPERDFGEDPDDFETNGAWPPVAPSEYTL